MASKRKLKVLEVASLATLPNLPDMETWIYSDINDMCTRPTKMNFVQADNMVGFMKEHFPSYDFINKTQTITIKDYDFYHCLNDFQSVTQNFKDTFHMNESQTVETLATYLKDKKIRIQPSGIAGLLNRGGNVASSAAATAHSFSAITASQTSGLAGLPLYQASPMLAVSLTFVGGVFFIGISRSTNITYISEPARVIGSVLCLPMRGTEFILNNLVIKPIGGYFGVDTALNATSALLNGWGFKPSDWVFLKSNRTRRFGTIVKKVVDFIS